MRLSAEPHPNRHPETEVHVALPIILIADADVDSRVIYSAVLQHHGLMTVEARDGAEALDMALLHGPDAVITETSLPVLSGLDLLLRLKQNPVTAQIRVIVVTADARPEVRTQAMERGCQAFLLKPCLPRDLTAAMRASPDHSGNPPPMSPPPGGRTRTPRPLMPR